MDFKSQTKNDHDALVALYRDVFSVSEGEQEGQILAHLVSILSSNVNHLEKLAYAAYEDETLIASIFFTRLFINQPYSLFMLSPVAVKTDYQGRGIGQALINYGLEQMRARSVLAVVTYGDPAFYAKTGFLPIKENIIPPPFELSMPEGWLCCNLSDKPLPKLNERPRCVEEFNNPSLW